MTIFSSAQRHTVRNVFKFYKTKTLTTKQNEVTSSNSFPVQVAYEKTLKSIEKKKHHGHMSNISVHDVPYASILHVNTLVCTIPILVQLAFGRKSIIKMLNFGKLSCPWLGLLKACNP